MPVITTKHYVAYYSDNNIFCYLFMFSGVERPAGIHFKRVYRWNSASNVILFENNDNTFVFLNRDTGLFEPIKRFGLTNTASILWIIIGCFTVNTDVGRRSCGGEVFV